MKPCEPKEETGELLPIPTTQATALFNYPPPSTINTQIFTPRNTSSLHRIVLDKTQKHCPSNPAIPLGILLSHFLSHGYYCTCHMAARWPPTVCLFRLPPTTWLFTMLIDALFDRFVSRFRMSKHQQFDEFCSVPNRTE